MSDDVFIPPYEAQAIGERMVELGSLAGNIVYLLPGCDDLMAVKTLQRALRTWCRDTECLLWTGDVKLRLHECEKEKREHPWEHPIPNALSMIAYAFIQSPYEANIISVKNVSIRDVTVPLREVIMEYGNPPRLRTMERWYKYANDYNDGHIRVTSSWFPILGSEVVPEHWLNQHAEAIIAYTMYVLKSMQNKPWADAVESGRMYTDYKNFVSEEKIKMMRGMVDNDLTGRTIPFRV